MKHPRTRNLPRETNARRITRIAKKDFDASVAPKRPPILFLYDDLNDPTETPTVFGMYPVRFISKILPWLKCARSEILHVCSGGLPAGEGIRVDIRPEAKPDFVADGRKLPFADASHAAVLIDPPYTEHYAAMAPRSPRPREPIDSSTQR